VCTQPIITRDCVAPKVVLNLRNHEIACETKMSRLMLMLANRAFVVSHTLGALSEPELLFREGAVFVDTPHLAPTLLYYLHNPAARAAVAARGYAALAAMPQWRALVAPVRALEVARGCDSTMRVPHE
jgi:hypothetical protein